MPNTEELTLEQVLRNRIKELERDYEAIELALNIVSERDRWWSVETEPPTIGEKYECRNPNWDFPGARQYTYSKDGFGFVNIHNVFVLPNIAQPTLYRQLRPI